MGASLQSSSQTSELQLLQTIHHPIYGPSQVYSSTRLPQCYIIRLMTPFESSAALQIWQQIEDSQNIYLLGLYGYKVGRQCQCSQGSELIEDNVVSYWQYLGYSLGELIENRKIRKLRLDEAELWHIIKACCLGYQTLATLGVCYDFMPSRLMITQEGRVRLDWRHVRQKNMHCNFYRQLHQDHARVESQCYLAPEQLQALKFREFTPKINHQKTNTFSLGMTLLYCIGLQEPTEAFYLPDLALNPHRIEACLASLQAKAYSKQIVSVIGQLLIPEPAQRPLLSQVLQENHRFMDNSYHIHIVRPDLNTFPQQALTRK